MKNQELLTQVRQQIKALEDEIKGLRFEPDYSSLEALEEAHKDFVARKVDLNFELQQKKNLERILVNQSKAGD